MKPGNAPVKIGILCLLLSGGAVGTWAVVHHSVQPATLSANPHNADAVISSATPTTPAALPVPTGNSLSDQMIAKWIAVVKKSDKDDLAWVNLGDSYMQKARETADVTYYAHAEQSYRRALDLRPKNVPALNGMAWLNGGRHEFEKSIEWANKAIAISPKDNDAYGLIGDADVEMGNYEAAYTHYQQMLDIRPDTSSYSRGAHLL